MELLCCADWLRKEAVQNTDDSLAASDQEKFLRCVLQVPRPAIPFQATIRRRDIITQFHQMLTADGPQRSERKGRCVKGILRPIKPVFAPEHATWTDADTPDVLRRKTWAKSEACMRIVRIPPGKLVGKPHDDETVLVRPEPGDACGMLCCYSLVASWEQERFLKCGLTPALGASDGVLHTQSFPICRIDGSTDSYHVSCRRLQITQDRAFADAKAWTLRWTAQIRFPQ